MAARTPCAAALTYLEANAVKPSSKHLSPDSVPFYIPTRAVWALLEDKTKSVTLKAIFLCPCSACVQDGGSVSDRKTAFNGPRVQTLQTDYALIYALLIYIRRPGLIRKFQKHGRRLQSTEYLTDASFDVFRAENVSRLDVLRRQVVDYQYCFLVRTLRPAYDITVISPRELLPIREDPEPRGVGVFAEVRCFEFQDDEYRSRQFGQITRFARKIFKPEELRFAVKEWNSLQTLSREEQHAHLMLALGAYQHGPQFFILMEEADHTLADYLKGTGAKYESRELWKQMLGVTDGLASLHNFRRGTQIGYHRDMKPANILIVRRVFKIADFGLLEFEPVASSTGASGVVHNYNTGYYAPPRQRRYTRDGDIWSLGCIISEMANVDILGRSEYDKYRSARIGGKHMPSFFLEQTVKDAVLDRHTLLQNSVQSGTRLRGGAATVRFQQRFYTRDFFALLNAMFRVPSKTPVPDARTVARTIDALHRAAVPSEREDQVLRETGNRSNQMSSTLADRFRRK
ncbi:kinase-like domain-containing protein [Boeremia exigua]|uniref:kinase-like domain-containing protein n=1 Tax=Boeremia exigua TaxID=749465 RepID=UPI001E8D305E|nr:kinase-like domain-containing protein [Boeremia exigua]KAH6614310.1 kinase-like domain-containing protein [Boeremia exigua]